MKEDRIDLEHSLGAVTRTVSKEYEKSGKKVRNITLKRSYLTTTDDLWGAVTNPNRLLRFFSPVRGDLKLGGRFNVEGNADGTITDCFPFKSFSATWELAGEVSWIELQIKPLDDIQSQLSLTHVCPIDKHWETYGPGAGGVGWDLCLIGLEAHLLNKNFSLSDGEELLSSTEGYSFIVGASESWSRAAVDSGENVPQAESAMNQTIAFYTGNH